MDTIRYGPFNVPAHNATSTGMEEFQIEDASMPCRNCLITYMKPELIYEDGSIAIANTGLWLHHLVMLNMAKQMVNCPVEKGRERFFASGNERSIMDFESHT